MRESHNLVPRRREPGDEVKKVNSVETNLLTIVESMALGRVRLKKSFFKGGMSRSTCALHNYNYYRNS